jgi:hypothetical protein
MKTIGAPEKVCPKQLSAGGRPGECRYSGLVAEAAAAISVEAPEKNRMSFTLLHLSVL